jgi:hypothetical protein
LAVRREQGQAMVEVVAVTLVVTLALCTPWMDGESPAERLLGSLAALTGSFIDWLKVI